MSQNNIQDILDYPSRRYQLFPVARACVYLGHAGVAPISGPAQEAMVMATQIASTGNQERGWVLQQVDDARSSCARLIGAEPEEIALLGPTSLGLNIIADGIDWQTQDEVVFYQDDYPANVYPWRKLAARGVKLVEVKTQAVGVVTLQDVLNVLTSKTRLVALASCHFLSGYRIDIDGIGQALHERGVMFALDGIQTFGAAPVSMKHVDFASADSHKWMLGPSGAGLLYVNQSRFDQHRPSILGSWNVLSPEFVAQNVIDAYYEGGRRYEPGMLNLVGIAGMNASIKLLLEIGLENIEARLLVLRDYIIEQIKSLGFKIMSQEAAWDRTPTACSGIITFRHPELDMHVIYDALQKASVESSLRKNRADEAWVRFSPHFYTTESEIDLAVDVIKKAMK